MNYQKGDSGIQNVETRVAKGAEQQIKAAICNVNQNKTTMLKSTFNWAF